MRFVTYGSFFLFRDANSLTLGMKLAMKMTQFMFAKELSQVRSNIQESERNE